MDRAQLAAWSSSAGPGSQSMLAAIARALRLTRDERDHLFHLAGHTVPDRSRRSDHVNPALLHVLDRLDTPAQVMSDLGWTLVQNPMAVALLGDQTRHVGPARSIIHRFFLDPEERWIYPPEDHEHHARLFTAGLRAATSRGPDAQAAALAEELRAGSPEFARLQERHEVGVPAMRSKRMVHPAIGAITLDCLVLSSDEHTQVLLVYTAQPGTEDHQRLELLSVVGRQELAAQPALDDDARG